ncbi:MAG TPA: hypothetical protein VNU93_06370, partial [Verrucomicrobiae bacterium]|nr:hypothetical protein [Verrucomicrobiae bacterium]
NSTPYPSTYTINGKSAWSINSYTWAGDTSTGSVFEPYFLSKLGNLQLSGRYYIPLGAVNKIIVPEIFEMRGRYGVMPLCMNLLTKETYWMRMVIGVFNDTYSLYPDHPGVSYLVVTNQGKDFTVTIPTLASVTNGATFPTPPTTPVIIFEPSIEQQQQQQQMVTLNQPLRVRSAPSSLTPLMLPPLPPGMGGMDTMENSLMAESEPPTPGGDPGTNNVPVIVPNIPQWKLIKFDGTSGHIYHVCTSSNLVNWESLTIAEEYEDGKFKVVDRRESPAQTYYKIYAVD